jgi:hypothetical protein
MKAVTVGGIWDGETAIVIGHGLAAAGGGTDAAVGTSVLPHDVRITAPPARIMRRAR